MIALPTADRPGVLAELGQTCGSDVGAYVEAVHAFADAGAWGVKVQMIAPERLAAPSARPYWQTTRYAASQASSFVLAGVVPHDGWGPVREACERRGVAFVATPFDLGAVAPLRDLDPDAVKIASGDITYRQLLDEVGERFAQVILSTGASVEWEVRQALRWFREARDAGVWVGGWEAGVMPLACSLEYPCPWEAANLARVDRLRSITGLPCGYSDHTVQRDPPAATVAGAALGGAGAVLVEKHVALYESVGMVPDLDMAMGPDLLPYFVEGLTLGAELRGSPSLTPYPGEAAAREGARRTVYLTRRLEAGDVVTGDDLAILRPCPPGAPPPEQAASLIGRAVSEAVDPGRVDGWWWEPSSDRLTLVTVAG